MSSLFFFIISFLIFSDAKASTLDEHKMQYWLKLLHYRPGLFGGMISEVDSDNFFLSQEGKTSPQKELEVFIELLDSPRAQEVVCRFPLRYKFLKKNIPNHWQLSTQSCEIYQSFVSKLDAKNLSLVFSSFYINNPGSTFGHTFLRIGRYRDFRQNELLDYAVNFAAQEEKDNVFIYMLKGLAGYYPGRFSVIPYYYKIREYNDHEFRDIWDYDLGLNQEQIDRVIDHIWEMGPVYFDYYYFTENCSYHILGLLNVAYEDQDILKGLNPLYVLPIDTIKLVKSLGLIKDKKVRVSAYRKLLKETEGMGEEKLKIVKEMAQNPIDANKRVENFPVKEAAGLLDASLSAFDYLNAEKVLLLDEKTTEQRRELLMLRADNPHISDDLDFNLVKITPPDEGHNSARWGLSMGSRSQQGRFGTMEWRAAQHELLDPSQGHLKNSQVVMFDLRFRYQEVQFKSSQLVLDRFRLIDLKKYQASDFWNDSVSFDLALGIDQRRDCRSQDCLDPVVSFGVGSSVDFFKDFTLSILVGGSYLYDRIYENDSLLNLGPKLNLLVLKEKFALGWDFAYFLPSELFDGWMRRKITYGLDARYFYSPNTSFFINASGVDENRIFDQEAQMGIYFYH